MTTPAISRNVLTQSKYTRTFPNGSVDTLTSSVGATVDREQRPASVNGGRLRGYKLCSGWTHSSTKAARLPDSCSYLSGTTLLKDAGDIWDGVYPSALMAPSSLIGEAQTKALLKLKSQDIHLGNFLAEGHKTVEMVTRRASSIVRQVSSFRRKRPKDWDRVVSIQTGNLRRDRWCEIPNSWLELQYGWNPLMSDIYGSLQHLEKRKRFNVPFVTVKQTLKDQAFSQQTSSSAAYSSDAHFVHDQRVTCFMTFGLKNAQLAELSSLGLINPAEILWEVTRYSFVVDWFLPIGNWLSALTGAAGYDFITGGLSSKSVCTFKRSGVKFEQIGGRAVSYPSGVRWSGESSSYSRTCYANTPFPGLYVKNPISAKHIANALSLLVQAFR